MKFFTGLSSLGLVVLLTACGGGGGGGGITPGSSATPCPPGYTGTAPACVLQTTNSGSFSPQATATSAPLPAAGGYSGTIGVPPATGSGTVNVVSSTQVPTGVPVLQGHVRKAQSTANTPLLYITITPTSAMTFNGSFGLTVTLPSTVTTSGPYYVATYQGGAWQTVAGPVSPSSGTVTFAGSTTGTVTVPANTPIYLAVYSGGMLGTVVASASVVIGGNYPVSGQAGTYPVTVVAKDASGNVITGAFANGITLANSDTSGVTSLSNTTFATSTSTATLTYTGATLANGATLSASATGVAPTALTSATFAPNNQDPRPNGASLTYTVTDVFQQVGPVPSPTPSTSTLTRTVTMSTGATFNGLSGLVQAHAVDTNFVPVDPAGIPTTTTDTFFQYVPGATTTKVLAVGSTWTSVLGNQTQTSNDAFTPGSLLEQLPLTTKDTWNTFSPEKYTFTQSVAGTTTETASTQRNADGSSSSSDVINSPNFVDGFVETVNADLSDSSTLNFAYNGSSYSNYTMTHTIGTPSGGFIPVTQKCTVGTAPAPSPAPVATPDPNSCGVGANRTINVRNWYPITNTGSDVSTVLGTVTIPSSCNVPATFGTTATQIRESWANLIPGGIFASATYDSYFVPGVGMVCYVSSYDNKGYAALVDGRLWYEYADTTTMTLQSAKLPTSAMRSTMAASAMQVLGAQMSQHQRQDGLRRALQAQLSHMRNLMRQ